MNQFDFFSQLLFCSVDVRSQCEDSWVEYDKTCYKEVSLVRTFEVARTECKNRGAILASIPSTEVQTFIMENGMHPYRTFLKCISKILSKVVL